MSKRENSGSARLKFALHVLFLASGTGTVLIGQLLPLLARQYGLDDLEVSFYFPSQLAGSLLGTYLAGLFARRDSNVAASYTGALLMAAGLLLMNIGWFPASLAAFAVNGVGIGLTLPAINMAVIDMSPLRRASALSFLNLFWGIGAIICKPFVDATSRGNDIRVTTTILAAVIAAFGVLLYIERPAVAALPHAEDLEDEPPPIWRMPLAWAIALFNFIHVGYESGMAGWLTSYSDRLSGEHYTHWLSPTLAYFCCFVLGRGVAPALFRFFNENKMLMFGLIIVLCGTALSVAAGSMIWLGVGSAIAGFGTSWIFPTNVSSFSHTFGPAAARNATPLFVCGTLGAVCSTWLIGYVSNQTGELRWGMYVLVASVVLLIALQALLAVRTRQLA